MESLRGQLAETQGALTERDKKFRELRAEQKAWLEAKSTLESRIAHLESENASLQKAPPTPGDESSKSLLSMRSASEAHEIYLTHRRTESHLPLKGQQDTDGDETVTIKRSRMEQAEKQFQQLADELAQRNKQCDALTTKLTQLIPTSKLELNDNEAVVRWNQLREQIRTLSLEHIVESFLPGLPLSNKSKEEFKMLSPHWKSYTTAPNMGSYLLRALMWRYILRYFEIPCRSLGRDTSTQMGAIAETLRKNLSDNEYHSWRIRTAALLHKTRSIDTDLIDETVAKVQAAVSPLVRDATSAALEVAIRGIVESTAKLSAAFDLSNFVVLMFNKPGGTLMHSFPYVEELMDMKEKLGGQTAVDLMITPSLLKRGVDYSVMVKAEVIC